MTAPGHVQDVPSAVPSQGIIDTGLMLRRAVAEVTSPVEARAVAAERHATGPMAARPCGQEATATTWGAVLAKRGNPLCDALDRLPALRAGALSVSLSRACESPGEAQAATRALCAQAASENTPLPALAKAACPNTPADKTYPLGQAGHAAAKGRACVARAETF